MNSRIVNLLPEKKVVGSATRVETIGVDWSGGCVEEIFGAGVAVAMFVGTIVSEGSIVLVAVADITELPVGVAEICA